jgi:hypothetical protein
MVRIRKGVRSEFAVLKVNDTEQSLLVEEARRREGRGRRNNNARSRGDMFVLRPVDLGRNWTRRLALGQRVGTSSKSEELV